MSESAIDRSKSEGVTSEKQLILDERDNLHKALTQLQEESSARISQLEQEIHLLTAKLRQTGEDETQTVSKMRSQQQALQESLRKFQSQLAQTQSLLMVVQEQRKNLQVRGDCWAVVVLVAVSPVGEGLSPTCPLLG